MRMHSVSFGIFQEHLGTICKYLQSVFKHLAPIIPARDGFHKSHNVTASAQLPTAHAAKGEREGGEQRVHKWKKKRKRNSKMQTE